MSMIRDNFPPFKIGGYGFENLKKPKFVKKKSLNSNINRQKN